MTPNSLILVVAAVCVAIVAAFVIAARLTSAPDIVGTFEKLRDQSTALDATTSYAAAAAGADSAFQELAWARGVRHREEGMLDLYPTDLLHQSIKPAAAGSFDYDSQAV